MTTELRGNRGIESSPQLWARTAGVLYVIVGVSAVFAQVLVRSRVMVPRNAAATAVNILAHESLFRLGGVSDLINVGCDTVLALIFYALFARVSRSLALLAASFRLVHVAILGLNTILHFGPLIFLRHTYVSTFSDAQLQELAFASLRLHAQGYNIALLFFGVHCALLGYLVYKSGYVPRVIGALMSVAGCCYVINSLAAFLDPVFKAQIGSYTLALTAGELFLPVWLLVRGVDVQGWTDQASASPQSDALLDVPSHNV